MYMHMHIYVQITEGKNQLDYLDMPLYFYVMNQIIVEYLIMQNAKHLQRFPELVCIDPITINTKNTTSYKWQKHNHTFQKLLEILSYSQSKINLFLMKLKSAPKISVFKIKRSNKTQRHTTLVLNAEEWGKKILKDFKLSCYSKIRKLYKHICFKSHCSS